MFSIREQTFETNSSSCHCFVFCRDDLRQKIENQEVLYTGPFTYNDDNGTYENNLNPDEVMDANQVIDILDKFKNDTDVCEEYMQAYQDWLKTNDFKHMSLKELLGANSRDNIDLSCILERHGIYYTPSSRIFGVEGPYGESDTHILHQQLTNQQGEPTWVLYTHVGC